MEVQGAPLLACQTMVMQLQQHLVCPVGAEHCWHTFTRIPASQHIAAMPIVA